MQDTWQRRAHQLKTETYALYLAYRDPRVSWLAKLWLIGVVAYAFSPIDLIPDFIPVLGYLDDLVLIPLGIVVAVKLVPPEVMAECRERARMEIEADKPKGWVTAVIIFTIWLFLAILAVSLIVQLV
jgi:uncharacterized membrane protein YkvA (DUF1232 family)